MFSIGLLQDFSIWIAFSIFGTGRQRSLARACFLGAPYSPYRTLVNFSGRLRYRTHDDVRPVTGELSHCSEVGRCKTKWPDTMQLIIRSSDAFSGKKNFFFFLNVAHKKFAVSAAASRYRGTMMGLTRILPPLVIFVLHFYLRTTCLLSIIAASIALMGN